MPNERISLKKKLLQRHLFVTLSANHKSHPKPRRTTTTSICTVQLHLLQHPLRNTLLLLQYRKAAPTATLIFLSDLLYLLQYSSTHHRTQFFRGHVSTSVHSDPVSDMHKHELYLGSPRFHFSSQNLN